MVVGLCWLSLYSGRQGSGAHNSWQKAAVATVQGCQRCRVACFKLLKPMVLGWDPAAQYLRLFTASGN
jgi:hypothetical protein